MRVWFLTVKEIEGASKEQSGRPPETSGEAGESRHGDTQELVLSP